MYNRTIHYAILEKDYALVKFQHINGNKIYLKSVLRSKIKDQATKFLLVKSNRISDREFEDYLESLKGCCSLKERRGNVVTLKANDPF